MVGQTAPEMGDPVWAEWSATLLTFLVEPRDWPALRKWGKSNHATVNKIRHMLAWAEQNEQAHAFYREGRLLWAAGSRPVLGELDEGPLDCGLGQGDREGEGDDDPVVPVVATPQHKFVRSPLDCRDL